MTIACASSRAFLHALLRIGVRTTLRHQLSHACKHRFGLGPESGIRKAVAITGRLRDERNRHMGAQRSNQVSEPLSVFFGNGITQE